MTAHSEDGKGKTTDDLYAKLALTRNATKIEVREGRMKARAEANASERARARARETDEKRLA